MPPNPLRTGSFSLCVFQSSCWMLVFTDPHKDQTRLEILTLLFGYWTSKFNAPHRDQTLNPKAIKKSSNSLSNTCIIFHSLWVWDCKVEGA